MEFQRFGGAAGYMIAEECKPPIQISQLKFIDGNSTKDVSANWSVGGQLKWLLVLKFSLIRYYDSSLRLYNYNL